MSLRDAYRDKLQAQIDELSARLALARAKARQQSAATRIALYEELGATEEKLESLKTRLKSFNAARTDAWEDLKTGLDQGWKELSASAKRALSRFD